MDVNLYKSDIIHLIYYTEKKKMMNAIVLYLGTKVKCKTKKHP